MATESTARRLMISVPVAGFASETASPAGIQETHGNCPWFHNGSIVPPPAERRHAPRSLGRSLRSTRVCCCTGSSTDRGGAPGTGEEPKASHKIGRAITSVRPDKCAAEGFNQLNHMVRAPADVTISLLRRTDRPGANRRAENLCESAVAAIEKRGWIDQMGNDRRGGTIDEAKRSGGVTAAIERRVGATDEWHNGWSNDRWGTFDGGMMDEISD